MGLFLTFFPMFFSPACQAEEDSKPYGLTLGLFLKHVETSDNTNEDMGLIAFSYNNSLLSKINRVFESWC